MKPSITKNLLPVTNRKIDLKVIGTWKCVGIKHQEVLKPSQQTNNSNSFKGRTESKSIKAQKNSQAIMNYMPKQMKQSNPAQTNKELTWVGTKPQKERQLALTWIIITSCAIYGMTLVLTYTRKWTNTGESPGTPGPFRVRIIPSQLQVIVCLLTQSHCRHNWEF